MSVPIKAIVFDFWGVLAKMDPPMNAYLAKRGIAIQDHFETIHRWVVQHDLDRINEKEFIRRVAALTGVPLPYPKLKFVYRKALINHALVRIVKKLKKRYRVGILSNNNREYAREFIFKLKLNQIFDGVVLSYKLGKRKPSPAAYRAIAKRLKVKLAEVLYIDDEADKLIPAWNLGMQTMLYKGKQTDKRLNVQLLSEQ